MRVMKRAPDMTGKASEIDDPMALFARIGYRVYLDWLKGEASPVYAGWNKSECRRVAELLGEAQKS